MQSKSAYQLRIAALSFSMLIGATTLAVSPAAALETVEKSVDIKATPHQIVEAIVKHRTSEPEKRKIVSTKKDGAVVIKERLDSPLPIARDTIVYEEAVDNNRVEYRLVDAEKLTTFEGSWTMTEGRPGYTHVRLTASVDSSVKVPFKAHILRNEAAKGIDRRLSFVKQQSEKL